MAKPDDPLADGERLHPTGSVDRRIVGKCRAQCRDVIGDTGKLSDQRLDPLRRSSGFRIGNDACSSVLRAAVGRVSRFVRDATKREILFDLDTVLRRIFAARSASNDYDPVAKSAANRYEWDGGLSQMEDQAATSTTARLLALTPMLQTRDINHTVAWYESVLGFRCTGKQTNWCRLERDKVALTCMRNAHLGEPHATATQYIHVDDVMALWNTIKDRVTAEWGPEQMPYGMLEFAIRDPDGYLLSFGERI